MRARGGLIAEGERVMGYDEGGFLNTRRAAAYLDLSPRDAGWLPGEWRGTCLPPLREPGALSQNGSRPVGGGAQGDNDSGSGQARHSVSAEAGADTA